MSAEHSHWHNVSRCPGCRGLDLQAHGQLPGREYFFGEERIDFPLQGVHILQCRRCGLFFKNIVPSLEFLGEVFSRRADKAWGETLPLHNERRFIESYVSENGFDLLDVGPSNGALLNCFSDLPGRRSGLDVVRSPELEIDSSSEYIEGLIDIETLDWSRAPYDVVTLFDVFEHFYRPDLAFSNLRALLKKDGVVVIETGNVLSRTAVADDAAHWWYARLFEHHVFWSPVSIRYYAELFGFEILKMEKVRHKSILYRSLPEKLRRLTKFNVWKLAPDFYKIMANKLHLWSNRVPLNPLSVDHIRVVMKRP